jgi:hypothetical protein
LLEHNQENICPGVDREVVTVCRHGRALLKYEADKRFSVKRLRSEVREGELAALFTSGRSKWLLAAGAVAIAILLLSSSLSYRGICFTRERFLSDPEYFAAAISQIIHRDKEQLISYNQSETTYSSVHVLKYANADEFQRQNPQCCKIVPHNVGDSGPYTSFSQRLFGYAAKIVSITYLVRYTDETGGQKSVLKTEQFAVTNCGRTWR